MFFVIAGILTLLMRLQVTRPDASILGSGTYRGVLTMHGTLLVFFVLVPVVTGLATFLVPLLIGSTRIAMPGLAAAALWLFVFAGAAVVLSAFAGGGSSQAGGPGSAALARTEGQRRRPLADRVAPARDLAARLGDEPRRDDPVAAHGRDGVAEHADVRVGGVRVVVADDRARHRSPRSGSALVLLERRFSGSFDFFLDGDQTVEPKLIWLFGQTFAYVALVPVLGIVAEIVAVFSGRAIANARMLAQSSSRIGGLMILVVIYHAYRAASARSRACVLLAPRGHRHRAVGRRALVL